MFDCQRGMMLVQFSFAAGMRTATHRHLHGQMGYRLSGEIDLIMEQKESVRLSSGCSSYVVPNVKRRCTPRGYDSARLLYTCS